ncbi:hypothetical protein [Chryseobacterium indoltheticum]|nr:hypothetical protein [Chryseobacterium indoltheticum]
MSNSKETNPNYPSKTGNPSGGNRGNTPKSTPSPKSGNSGKN